MLALLETLEMPPAEVRDSEVEWEPDQALAPLMQKLFKVGKQLRCARYLRERFGDFDDPARAAFSMACCTRCWSSSGAITSTSTRRKAIVAG